MKKFMIFLCVILMVGCRAKKTVVQDQYHVEVRDSTVKREKKQSVEVSGVDTSKVESIVEEVMTIHFTDSGGRVEVLPDGSLRMQGVKAANGVIRGKTRQEKGVSNNAKTDDVYLDSTALRGDKQAYSHEKKQKQPPNNGLVLVVPIVLFGLVVMFVVRRFMR
jgi:hypothetical protein